MNLGLRFRERFDKVGTWLRDELDGLIADAQTGWNVDHQTNGHHRWVYELDRDVPMGYWKSYLVRWVGSGAAQPAIGNGILRGRYIEIGETTYFWVGLLVGSATTLGTAGSLYSFTLPTPIAPLLSLHDFDANGMIYDSSADLGYSGQGVYLAVSASVTMYTHGAGRISDASPVVPATNDFWRISGKYRKTMPPEQS
jgi:hypothetical protein